jgi:transposase
MPANVRKKDRVALLLAQGMSMRAAARKADVNEKTVRRWREDPEFGRMVDTLRSRMTDRALGKLTASQLAAADELRRLLKSKDERIRRDAAKQILEQGVRLSELQNIVPRLEALEAAAEAAELKKRV